MTRWRLPARLARREVRRRPGRTLLVALLVAIPVAGMASAVVLFRTGELSLAEEYALDNGTADARVLSWAPVVELPSGEFEVRDTSDPSMPPLVARFPPGSRFVPVGDQYLRVRTPDDGPRSDLEITDIPVDDPLTAGIVDVVAGRAPTAPREVALARRTASRLEVGIGDTLVLDHPRTSLEVVGYAEDADCLGCPTALVAPGTVDDAFPVEDGSLPTGHFHLVDLPAQSSAELAQLAASPIVYTRSEATDPALRDDGSTDGVRWSLVVGAVVLTVMGIVISAALAVGARRQLVTLGQLSASGASPATLRLALVLQGTFTGAVGAVLGLSIAGVGLPLLHNRLEHALDRRFGEWDVHALDLLAAVVVALVASTVAALVPARTAARVPTLAALAGRRPQHPVPRRLVVAGVTGVAIGLALLGLAVLGSAGTGTGEVWVLVAIAGGVCELLGACAIAPALVARLEPFAGRVRGAWRLGARGLARNRARTGAVVSAVAAAGALAIASTALVRGADQRETDSLDLADDVVAVHELMEEPVDPELGFYRSTPIPPSADVRAAVERILPEAEQVEVRLASASSVIAAPLPDKIDPQGPVEVRNPLMVETDPRSGYFADGYGYDWAVVVDDQVLDLVGLSGAARSALERDGAVLIRASADDPGVLVAPDGSRRPIAIVAAEHSAGRSSEVLVTEDFARELGLTVAPSAVLFRNPSALTSEQRDGIEDLWIDASFVELPDGAYRSLAISWHRPSDGPSPFQLELILSGIALVFALLVVGASLALAAAESKDERDILTVAGAPPRALARSAGARAWLLAGLGGALAVPIGFLPVVVVTRASDGLPLVFPATTVALLLGAVPTIVGLIALVSSTAAQRLRPVRVSTATFE